MTAQAAFTLLELLVVLVILGFTSSFVTPDLWRSYEKSQQRSVIQEFALSLDEYRIQAYRSGRTVEIVKEDITPEDPATIQIPSLPTGWTVETATTLRFLPTGVTNGAQYKIKSPDRHWLLIISPLDGDHEISLR
jgi:general secretion pathway protein G